MEKSIDYPQYHVFEASLGVADALEAVFNNGEGNWDNNGGKNYMFKIGESSLVDGVISSGLPK